MEKPAFTPGFILHPEMFDEVKLLTIEERGEFITAVFCHQREESYEIQSAKVKLVFQPVQRHLDRMKDKYIAKCQKTADNKRKREAEKAAEENRQPKKTRKPFSKSASENIIEAIPNEIVQPVIDQFHALCPSFNPIKSITKTRRENISMRLTESGGIDVLSEVFKKMEASVFLKGDNDKNWKASFDWLFKNPDNWVKVHEGEYDHKFSDRNDINFNNETTEYDDL